ncbi:MAG: mechanosensitive ion channel family protein [Minisyncoccia bacterium]
MIAQTWSDIIALSFQNVWTNVMSFLPTLIISVLVLLVGLIIASILGTVVEKIFDALKLDVLLSKIGLTPYFERAGLKLRGAYFLGQLVNWFLIIVFLLATSDMLGLYSFSTFLKDVLNYLPNVIAAVLIMLAAVVIANFLRKVVSASVASAKLHASKFLGTLTWWAVVIFGVLTALIQLNIAPSVINSLITGVIAMLALAGGLAFGLGGKSYAEYLVNKLREHTEHR